MDTRIRKPLQARRGSRRTLSMILIVALLAVWLVIIVGPVFRPLVWALAGAVLFGFGAVGGALGLGYLGFGLDRALTGESRKQADEDSAWPEFSPRAEVIPPAKPDRPTRLARLGLPLLVLGLILVFLLSASGDRFGLLRLIFGGSILAFGLVVILALAAGVTLAFGRALRGMAGGLRRADDPDAPFSP